MSFVSGQVWPLSEQSNRRYPKFPMRIWTVPNFKFMILSTNAIEATETHRKMVFNKHGVSHIREILAFNYIHFIHRSRFPLRRIVPVCLIFLFLGHGLQSPTPRTKSNPPKLAICDILLELCLRLSNRNGSYSYVWLGRRGTKYLAQPKPLTTGAPWAWSHAALAIIKVIER